MLKAQRQGLAGLGLGCNIASGRWTKSPGYDAGIGWRGKGEVPLQPSPRYGIGADQITLSRQ